MVSVYKPCLISFIAAVDIYAGVAASLAERKKGSQLTEFFRNIKGTIDDDDWDQVIMSLSKLVKGQENL